MIKFLKLGGSLITDKTVKQSARNTILDRLAVEIAAAIHDNPDTIWLFGHGSGSFGHYTASEFSTQNGFNSSDELAGFVEVWRDARRLNRIVLDTLSMRGLPVIHFPPSAFLTASNRSIKSTFADPIVQAMEQRIIPLVAGDVIFDDVIGGTIFSTEEVFLALSTTIVPDQILLCGLDEGVFADYPENTELIPFLPIDAGITELIKGSSGVDVTGGMQSKVKIMSRFVDEHPTSTVQIFSGLTENTLYQVMCGAHKGTILCKEAS